jgi:hypothetical protein
MSVKVPLLKGDLGGSECDGESDKTRPREEVFSFFVVCDHAWGSNSKIEAGKRYFILHLKR